MLIADPTHANWAHPYRRDRTDAATPVLDSGTSPVTEPYRYCGRGVVVRLHQVLKDVDVSPRKVFREVSPHSRRQRSVESFHDARLRLGVVRGEVMDAVLLQ